MPRRKTPEDIAREEDEEISRLLQDDPETPGGISDEMLTALARLHPGYEKKVAFLRNIRAQRLQLEAKLSGGYSFRSPVLFAQKILGLRPSETARSLGYKYGLAPDSVAVLESIRDHPRTAVPAGHGCGKTHSAAVAVLWYLNSRQDTIVVTTAPTWTLVEAQLWKEIRDLHRSARTPLPGRLLETQLKISDKHFAIGISTDDHSRFQGFHGRGGTLIILDEATGVREELWDSAESMVVGPYDRILAIGNPTDPSSRFKRVCDSGRYNVLRLDSENHPNVKHKNPLVIPGAVTYEWVKDRLDEYGSRDSPLFRSRVSGFWPAQGQDTLIPLTLIIRAQSYSQRQSSRDDREKSIRQKRGGSLGLDISGFGEDLCVCTYCEDNVFTILWWHRHVELMETVGRIVRTLEDFRGDIRALAIDDTGIGNGVSSRLLEVQSHARRGAITVHSPNSLVEPLLLKPSDASRGSLFACNIIRVNFSQNSRNPTKFDSIKDEMWWNLRESLQHDLRGLPTDSQLESLSPKLPKGSSMVSQLTSPIYVLDSSGRIKVLDKKTNNSERQKLLPTKSPDIAHSIILAEHAYRTIRAEEIPRVDSKVDLRSQAFHRARLEAIHGHHEKQENPDYEGEYDYLQD